ncbi:flagellar biosynthesis anti-sigma factor FlgM [Burkholderia sp. BCC0044]|uniref:flagellar biosynthesis anti-sigma factor FlgM n=1 Tax=Burkholderia sp. BCC0044 TaxID=2676295 RepID=UPI00158AA414|nr:flagellar biosynthesis anti-sigma factor FlgM [Burkholderia sp. BCC0044]
MRIANLAGQPAINGTDSAPRNEDTQRKAPAVPLEAPDERTRDRQVLDAARIALDRTPEIDTARVAAVRAALAAGDIRFDAGTLAGVIQRYHGGRG